MTTPSSRSMLLFIIAGLVLWGVGLSIAVFMDWSDQWRLLRAVIVIGSVGLFLAAWLTLLWWTGRLRK